MDKKKSSADGRALQPSKSSAINWREARHFVGLIAGKADACVCWQVFDDTGKHPEWAEHRHGRLSDPEFREWLEAKNQQGCGIYICINETDGKGRRRQNIKRARAVWVDLDGAPLPDLWPVEPHIINESSKSRYHVFWLIEPTSDLSAASDLQARLAAFFDGDPKIIDPPRVCRVPGFNHHKGAPFRSRIIKAIKEGGPLEWLTLAELAKLHPCKYQAPAQRGDGGRSEEPEAGWDNPSDVSRARAFLNAAAPSIEGEHGDDNAYRIACRLNDLGISPEVSLELMLEDWNDRCSPPWSDSELERIIYNACRYKAGSAGLDSAQADFEGEPVDLDDGDDSWLDRGPAKPVRLSKVNADNIDDTFSFVNVSGKMRVLYWGKSQIDSKVRVAEFWNEEEFHRALKNKFVTVEKKTPTATGTKIEERHMPLSRWWQEKRDRYTYDGLIFDASLEEVSEQPDAINLWRGFAVPEEEDGDWSLMEAHIRNVIANGDEESADYIIRWLAWTIQNPTEQAEVALALAGGQGTGKGILGRAMCKLFGPHGLHISKPELLTGRFNAHFMQTAFLFSDEAIWPGHKDKEGVLKALVTEPTMVVEPKGMNAFPMRNTVKLFMASNEDWIVPAGVDDRRFAVFRLNESKKQDRAYFGKLQHQLDNGGLGAMLHDLRSMDLEGWHPRKNIPQTDIRREQQDRSLPPQLKWLADYLHSGVLDCQHPSYANRVRAESFYEAARRSVRGLQHWANIDFSRFLDGWNVEQKRSNGIWRVFPPLEVMRAEWKKRYPGGSDFDPSVKEWEKDTEEYPGN